MFYFMSCPCVLYDAQWPAALSVFSCSCERCLAAVFVVTEFVCVCVCWGWLVVVVVVGGCYRKEALLEYDYIFQ